MWNELFHPHSAVRTNDLHPAARAGMNGQPEAMQLYDCSHKTEAEAHARRISDLVGTVKTPQHGLPLRFADAAIGIADAHDGFIVAAYQIDVDPTAFGRKLDGMVNEVGDRLKQEIPVAAHVKLVFRLDAQIDILVLRDRLVDIAHLPQYFVQRDGTESRRSPAIFDFGQPQQRRDNCKRLVDIPDRLVYNRMELFSVAALVRPRSSARRARVSGVLKSWAMSLPTPASAWIIISISSSMPLTIMASFENGSSTSRYGRRSRKSPAMMRWTR